MAVQKNKNTRSKRGMRRSHDSLITPVVSLDKENMEMHLRHNVTAKGFYRGIKVIDSIKKK